MPTSPRHACSASPRCPNLAPSGQGPCDTHLAQRRAQHEEERGTSTERGYGYAWQKKRERILKRDPVCRDCQVAWSTEVDHVTPKSLGGTDDDDNLQGLCTDCHKKKSARETAFGRGKNVA